MNDHANNAKTPLGDLLQQIGQRLATSAQSPLIQMGELTLPDAAPQSTPLDPELAVAWRALLGDIGLAWQAEALATARRGGGIALIAPPPLGPAALLLLVAEQVRELNGVLLVLAPHQQALDDLAATVRAIDALLGGALPHLVVAATTRPPRKLPKLVLMTPETLHQRVLRLHNRAWARLWSELQGVVLPALDMAPGAPLGHIRWLLRRVARLRPLARPPQLFLSVAPLAEVESTLATLVDALPPIVAVNTSRVPLTWSLWRGGADPIQMALDVALALRATGLTVHVGARAPLERAVVAQRAAPHGVALAPQAGTPAHTLVLVGAIAGATLPLLAASGYRAVVVVTDQSVAAQTACAQPALVTPNLALPLPVAQANTYVDSAHLRCAAEESPLTWAEIQSWEVESLVERLERKGLLAALPGSQAEWQPVAAPGGERDSYSALHPASASGSVVEVEDEREQRLAAIDAASAERRFYPGAGMLGGYVERWADDMTVVLHLNAQRRTRAVRRTEVTVREQLAERSLDGGRADYMLGVGRVVVREEIVARLAIQGDGTLRRMPFDPPLRVQWSAPAVWIAAPQAPPELGETLAEVLPLLVRCSEVDVVPCVSDGVLYIVEAQPGGRGLVDELYMQFEALLHLAELAAQAVQDDPLWRGVVQAERAWADTILMPLATPKTSAAPVQRPSERRTRSSMVPSASEVAERRRFGRVRQRPQRRPIERELPPPPVAPVPPAEKVQGRPAQPMRLESQPPALPPPTPPQRRVRRDEPPPAPTKRPATTSRRRSNRSVARPASAEQPLRPVPKPQSSAAPRPVPKPTNAERQRDSAPVESPSSGPTVLPPKREPPPYERPPYQERSQRRAEAPASAPPAEPHPAQGRRDLPRSPASPDQQRLDLPHSQRPAPAEPQRAAPARPADQQQRSAAASSPPDNRDAAWRSAPTEPSSTEPQRRGKSNQASKKRSKRGGPAPGPASADTRGPAERSTPQQARRDTGEPARRSDSTARRDAAEPPPSRRDTGEPARRSDSTARRDTGEPPPWERRDTGEPARRSDSTARRDAGAPPRRAPVDEPAEPTFEASSDPAALLEKARRLREQREAELRRTQPRRAQAPRPLPEPEAEVESRFHPGDRVFCVPYGEGVVKKTRVRDGRELLLVAFPELGDLRVDPAVNAVRLISAADIPEDDE